jgi:hypothetical protein
MVTTTGTVSTTGSTVGVAQAARAILAMISSEAIVKSLVRIFSSELLVENSLAICWLFNRFVPDGFRAPPPFRQTRTFKLTMEQAPQPMDQPIGSVSKLARFKLWLFDQTTGKHRGKTTLHQ